MRTSLASCLLSLALLAPPLLSACGSSDSPTAVILVTDLGPGLGSVESVRFEVTPPDGDTPETSEGSDFPVHLTLNHRSSTPLEGYQVRVLGVDAEGGTVITRRAEVAFEKGETRVAELHLSSHCLPESAPDCGDQVCTPDGCADDALTDDAYGNYWGKGGEPPRFAGTPSTDGGTDGSFPTDAGDAGDAGDATACDAPGTSFCEGSDETLTFVACDDEGVETRTLCADTAHACYEATCDNDMGCADEPPEESADPLSCESADSSLPLFCEGAVCGGNDSCVSNGCRPRCEASAEDCRLDCGNVNRCTPICDGPDTCQINCSGARRCDAACLAGSDCVLTCQQSPCTFDRCESADGEAGQEQLCPDELFAVCNNGVCPSP